MKKIKHKEIWKTEVRRVVLEAVGRAGSVAMPRGGLANKLEGWLLSGDGHYTRRCGLLWQGTIKELVTLERSIEEKDRKEACKRISESLR